MKSAMPGTVNATSPCSGAYTRPLVISPARVGPTDGRLLLQPARDGARLARLLAARGHGPHVAALGRRRPLPPAPEEPVIQVVGPRAGCPTSASADGDRRTRREVPRRLPELLQEVRIAGRARRSTMLDGRRVPLDARFQRRLVSAAAASAALERADRPVVEEPLGVRARLRERSGKRRQTRPHDVELRFPLAGFVTRLADRRQLLRREVLHLVDEQRRRRRRAPPRPPPGRCPRSARSVSSEPVSPAPERRVDLDPDGEAPARVRAEREGLERRERAPKPSGASPKLRSPRAATG